MNIRVRNLLAALAVSWWVFPGLSNGAVTFMFNYTDPAGQGFNADGATGQQRRSALEQAASLFGSSALGAYTAVITMDASGSAPPLAAAGSNTSGDDPAGGGFGRTQVIRNKILSNGAMDLNGAAVDGTVDWNFSMTTWQLDINTPPMGQVFDFYSTVYHELTHALGWSHSILDLSGGMAMSGRDPFGNGVAMNEGGNGLPGEWNLFDQFLSDSTGARIINATTFMNVSVANWNALQVGGASPANGLFFDGPNARAANGGNPVGLFTPAMIQMGSSISHLDDENPALAGLMMLSATNPGPSARMFSAIELAILQDLGYTQITQIIPEPTSGLLAVFAALLAAAFRRRSNA